MNDYKERFCLKPLNQQGVSKCVRKDFVYRHYEKGFTMIEMTVVLLILVTLLLKKPLQLDPSSQGSLMFANSAGMALPLASSLFGAKGVLLCAPQMGIQNLLIFSYLPMVMSKKARFDIKKILTNRNILAILAGVIVFSFRIQVPAMITDCVNAVGGTLAPLSMFMIGMLMGGVSLKSLFGSGKLYLVTFLRLAGYPLLFTAVIFLSGVTRRIPFSREIFLVLLMCEASPAATLVTQMADAVRGPEEARRAGTINVVTTLLCVVTLPFMVFLYQILC